MDFIGSLSEEIQIVFTNVTLKDAEGPTSITALHRSRGVIIVQPHFSTGSEISSFL